MCLLELTWLLANQWTLKHLQSKAHQSRSTGTLLTRPGSYLGQNTENLQSIHNKSLVTFITTMTRTQCQLELETCAF
jgi:hypothetical protein